MHIIQNVYGVHIWQKARIIQDLFVCPVQQKNNRYTVSIFDSDGQEWVVSDDDYETIDRAMSASLDQVIKMKMALTELMLAYQLQSAGFFNAQEVDKIERQVWQW